LEKKKLKYLTYRRLLMPITKVVFMVWWRLMWDCSNACKHRQQIASWGGREDPRLLVCWALLFVGCLKCGRFEWDKWAGREI
jgi:hypothetical protein